MTTTDEIIQKIKDMGYVTIESSKQTLSYYKLTDGTIISAICVPDYFLEATDEGGPHFGGGSSNIVKAYVPKENRDVKKHKPYQPQEALGNFVERDMKFQILQEDFSNYYLDNGFTLSVKSVVAQVDKTSFYSQGGEPIYNIQTQPVFKILPPLSSTEK